MGKSGAIYADSDRNGKKGFVGGGVIQDSPRIHFITFLTKARSGAQVAQLQPWHGSTSRSV